MAADVTMAFRAVMRCQIVQLRGFGFLIHLPVERLSAAARSLPCKCIAFARDVVSDVHDVSSAHAALWSAWLGRVPRVDRRVHLCRTAPIARVDVHLHRAADGGGSGARRLRAAVHHGDSITRTQRRADEAAREVQCAARVREVYVLCQRRAGGGRAHEALNRRRRHLVGQALAHLLAHVARDVCTVVVYDFRGTEAHVGVIGGGLTQRGTYLSSVRDSENGADSVGQSRAIQIFRPV